MFREMASNNGATFCNEFETIKRCLETGQTVVSYLTNSKAYTKETLINFLDELDESLYPAIWADEIDTWGVSHASLMKEIKGYKAQPEEYKASFYTTMSKIAEKSAYCFSFTATESFEFKGKVETYGKLKYVSVNPLKEGEQKIHAPYVAHYGGTHFFSNSSNVYGSTDDTQKTIGLMIKRNLLIEKQTNLKRSILIGCGMDKWDEKTKKRSQYGKAPNPDLVIEHIVYWNKYLKDKFMGAVLTGDYSFTFDKFGNEIEKNLSELDIQEQIDDQKNPLKLLLVKNMGGRGVTFTTVKDIMLLKSGDASTPYGQSTETPHQFIGRGKSVYVGPKPIQDLFYTKYEQDIRNVPGYNQLANTYLGYLPDSERLRQTEQTHRKYDACTPDMLGKKYIDICSLCGSTITNKKSLIEFSEKEEELMKKILDSEFQI